MERRASRQSLCGAGQRQDVGGERRVQDPGLWLGVCRLLPALGLMGPRSVPAGIERVGLGFTCEVIANHPLVTTLTQTRSVGSGATVKGTEDRGRAAVSAGFDRGGEGQNRQGKACIIPEPGGEDTGWGRRPLYQVALQEEAVSAERGVEAGSQAWVAWLWRHPLSSRRTCRLPSQ